tara:strand:+ start:304 stop:510 length:207 start_codon:yes stop_codon:yes gene_type:complete
VKAAIAGNAGCGVTRAYTGLQIPGFFSGVLVDFSVSFLFQVQTHDDSTRYNEKNIAWDQSMNARLLLV